MLSRFLKVSLCLLWGLLLPAGARAADPPCTACHAGETGTAHHGQPAPCGQCHAPSSAATCYGCHDSAAPLHHGLAGQVCDDCHGPGFSGPTCRNCHTDPVTPTTGHHGPTVLPVYPCLGCHATDPLPSRDCASCHGARHDCATCHTAAQGRRRAILPEFSATSHHVQAQPTSGDCTACHDIAGHAGGTVRLRDLDGGPAFAFTDEGSATEFCLSCHDDDSKASAPFSDGLATSSRAWDGGSVGAKYTSAEVVSSNKYPPTAAAPNMAGQLYNTVPDVRRALSAHGNPAANQANGTASDARVPCLGCHNAHGSPAQGLLFSNATYQPASEEDFCWDCHANDAASPHKAWDYLPNDNVRDYWGEPRWGLNDGTGFKVDWMGSFAYKDAPFKGSHFHPSKRKVSDTNWPRSSLTCTSCHDPHGVDPTNALRSYMVPLLKGTWLISPYKEDRAPLASFASALRDGAANRYQSADQPRGAPDLPYNNPPNPGGGYPNGTGGAGHEGFFIDENTFGVWNPQTSAPAAAGQWRSVLSSGQKMQINRIAEADVQFAGLCLQCHPKTSLLAGWTGHGTVKGWGGARRDLFPRSLAQGSDEGPGLGMHAMGNYDSSESEEGAAYGRGYRWGVDPKAQQTSGYIQADYHQFACSKCHSPHATNMPRLLVTNCLDSGDGHTTYAKAQSAQANNCHSTKRNLAWNTLTPWVDGSPPVKHTLVATSTVGGSIAPAGSVLVEEGASQTFTIAANAGYALSYVKVDGVSQGAVASYTFNNVTANHTLSATFSSLNLAQGRTATASSTRSGTNPSYAAAMAIDGSNSTSWMSSTTSGAQWLRVDLGSSQSLSFVAVVWPTTYYARAFQIQTSTDGTNFTTRHTATAATGATTYASFDPVNARYVRVYCTTPNSSYYGVSELRVYPVAPHNNAPAADAGADRTGKPGVALSFTGTGTDSDGTVVGYSWNWGDGTADSAGPSATHAYAAEGVYFATLTVTDDRGSTGSDSAMVTVVANYPPTANAGADKAGKAGTAFSFTGSGSDADGTVVGYSWNWGDGTADTTEPSASHTYASAGSYTATLTVTDNLGATATDTALVSVAANQPPVADAGTSKAGKVGQAISFTGTGTDSDGTVAGYVWNWGDGTPHATTPNASHSYAAAGTYTATLTVTDDQGATGSDAAGVTVVVNLPPAANAGPDQTTTARAAVAFAGTATDSDGVVTRYRWRWADGSPDTDAQQTSHTYAAPGMYTATLIVTDDSGDDGYDTTLITVHPNNPPTANAGTDKAGTAGAAISFTGAGTDSDGTIADYSWNWGDSTADTNAQNASHTYAAAGTYLATLTVTDNSGDTDSDSVLVTVGAAPPSNLALGKAASASSTRTGTSYTAAKAVDGSTSTSWMSSSTSSAQWVRVDLGSSQSVSFVKVVWPATYYARAFQIQTSTDGSTFTTRYTGAAATGTITHASFAPVSARYVRVYCTTPNNTSYYGVSELEAYATALPNSPPAANAGADKAGTAGTALSFTGAGTDPDGTVAGYSWAWGDGTADTATQNASHTYAAAGTYTATLTVTDDRGATGTDTALVTVAAAPANLARGKTTSASTTRTGSSYASSLTVDGSTSTSWMSSTTSSAQWVRVDLGASSSISSVKVVWPATYYARDFQVQTSTDGTNFTSRASYTSQSGGTTNATFAAVGARYVRVYCTRANSSSYYGVSELEVYP